MPNEYLPGEKLRVFVLFSGGASSGIGLVKGPNHKKNYEIVGAGTNNTKASGIEKLQKEGIFIEAFDYAKFCEEKNLEPAQKHSNRRYHEEWSKKIEPFKPHVIALSGYFRIVPQDFLGEYPDTKNVHPMGLHYITPLDKEMEYKWIVDVGDVDPKDVAHRMKEYNYTRAFKGESAIFDALLFGHDYVKEIRATVHRATALYDEGPIEVESAPLPVDKEKTARMIKHRNFAALMSYANELQEELKVKGDIPAFRKAVELTAERRLEHRDGAVYFDGIRLPYKGLQLAE